MKHSQRLVGAAALSALLAACGGGSDDDQPSGTDIFPLAVGNRWEMEYNYRGVIGPRTYEVVNASQSPDGVTSYSIRWSDLPDFDEVYQHTATGVYRLREDHSFQTLLRLPMLVGDSWTDPIQTVDAGEDMDLDGVNEVIVMTSQSRVEAIEDVTTPAGTFKGSYAVRRNGTNDWTNTVTGEVYRTGTWYTDENYVVGVGLVYRVSSDTPPDGPWSRMITEKLKSYRVAPN